MTGAAGRREVAAAVVLRAGRVLVQTRHAPARFAGFWEFPGGGLEPGESVAQCAVRECHEELGLAVEAQETLHVEEWSYDEVTVRVTFVLCRPQEQPGPGLEAASASPAPRPLLGQQLMWAGPADLARLPFLPANARVLQLLAARLGPVGGA